LDSFPELLLTRLLPWKKLLKKASEDKPAEKTSTWFAQIRVLVHLRLANCKHERTIPVEGFGSDTHRPVLTDETGRSYTFLEQRPRKPAKGDPVFEASGPRAAKLSSLARQDYLLVFSPAPSKFEVLKLELPASAWGRDGVCKLRIPRPFDASVFKKG